MRQQAAHAARAAPPTDKDGSSEVCIPYHLAVKILYLSLSSEEGRPN